ncbi:phosphoserine phosphatase SerB [Sulfurospirillum oryzae]|uniref:phosphoserine phosphatase SerB n=1 Tax=Sulfurospirillum oryzae TaxID=2976535 RepID=UPI0021E9ACED|nr:phosphoserine phosphatase SerB [Sulfurospirillum oryzae]
MKLCVFDFDSTLMDGETIDFLAKEHGVEKEVSMITEAAMRGELDFFESLTTRVGLLKGMNARKAEEICHALPLMKGAYETIAGLKAKGYTVIVFSGGFRIATTPAKEILGFDADFANVLHARDGHLSGLVGGDMMFGFSKGDMLRRVQNLLHVSYENTIAVGDGANDISMFECAAKKVAFCAKPILKNAANVVIDEKDMRNLLQFI